MGEERIYVDKLEELKERHHVLRVGVLKPEWIAGIVELSPDNLEAVLTQPRWAYIQSKPDRRSRFVDLAFAAVRDPDDD